MNIDEFLELAHKRRSIRKWKPDPVPDEYIDKILEAGRWAMSGANAQPWEFIVIKNKKTIAAMAEIYHTRHMDDAVELESHLLEELRQPQIYTAQGPPAFKEAPVVIAVVGDQRASQASVLQAYLFGGQDVLKMALANCAQMMHLAIAALGLGSQWVSITQIYEDEFKRLLGVPAYYRIRYIIPVGYPDYKLGPTYRRDLKDIVHREKYDMSKFRTNDQIREWLVGLRKHMRARYPIMPKP